MKCAQVQDLLAGYLDGALPDSVGPEGHLGIGQHLAGCRACRDEQARYAEMSMMMSSLVPMAPPPDLGVSIRVAVGQARATQGIKAQMRHWKNRLELVFRNILEPLALPVTAGVLVAMVVFAMVYPVLGTRIRLGASTPDSPTSLLQPARLEMLAGFRVGALGETSRGDGQRPLLVEATVSAEGEAVSYRVLSGDVTALGQRELDQVVLFSRFRPQMSFGRPTSGGRVVLSFNQISVRG